MKDLASIIDSINGQLDPEAVVRALKYHPDKIQVSGNNLKAFCPIHNEKAFRSLIVDLAQKQYRCMMKHCPAFEGGPLVKLWALNRNLELLEAAIELAELFKVDIDLELLRGMGSGLLKKAEKALSDGDLSLAQETIKQVLSFDPRDTEARLMAARIQEAEGNPEGALAMRLEIFETILEEGEPAEARTLLDSLLEANPDSPDLIERNLELARAEADPGRLEAALLQCAGIRAKAGDAPHEIELLEELARLRPGDVEIIVRLAERYGQTEDSEKQLGELAKLCRLYEKAEKWEAMLETLGQCLSLSPEEPTLHELMSRTLTRLGMAGEARESALRAVDLYAGNNVFERALALLDAQIAETPGERDLLLRLADLRNKAGEPGKAVTTLCELARLARSDGNFDEALDYYQRARSIDPHAPALLADQAETRISSGDIEGGLADLFELAGQSLEQGDAEAGRSILARVAELAPDDVDKRLRVGRMLERHDLAGEAYDIYAELARYLIAKERTDTALAVCEELRRMRPLDETTLELRIEACQQPGRRAEAVEVCREAAAAIIAGGDHERAEQYLQRAVKFDRSDTRAKADLARLYETLGRPADAAHQWMEMALFHRAESRHAEAVEAGREALRLAPESHQAKVTLAESLEAAGSTAEAREMWKTIGSSMVDGGSDSPEALKTLVHALELSPRDRELLTVVARMSYAQEGPEAARSYYVRWLAAADLSSEPMLTLDAYRQAVSSYPEERDWRRRLAELLLAANQRDEAAQHYEELWSELKTAGEAPGEQMALLERLVHLVEDRLDLRAEFAAQLAEAGRRAEAVAVWEELAETHLGQGELDNGVEALESALAIESERESLIKRTAELQERAGNARRAVELYERLAEDYRKGSQPALNIPILEKILGFEPNRLELREELATLYEIDGDADRAVEQLHRLAKEFEGVKKHAPKLVDICRRIIVLAPDFVQAREMLVEGLLGSKKMEEACNELDALGDRALADDDLGAAEGYFKRVREINPSDVGSGERLGKLYEARGDQKAAAAAYEDVLALYEGRDELARAAGVLQKLRALRPGDADTVHRLASMLMRAEQPAEAGEAWLAWISLMLTADEREKLEKQLKTVEADFADDWSWRRDLAHTLEEHGWPEAARRSWVDLAGAALEAREPEVALEACDAALENDSDAIDLRELRVQANAALSRPAEAAGDLELISMLCSDQGRHAEAADYLKRALDFQPSSLSLLAQLAEMQIEAGAGGDACVTLRRQADAHSAAGDHSAAIDSMKRVIELAPEDEGARNRLVEMLRNADRVEEAMAIWREMAEASLAVGDHEAALSRLARILEYLPGNIDILRRQADIHYDIGGMIPAMPYYDRLVDALHEAGVHEEIVAEYERILDMEPGHLQLKERFAEYLHDHGDKDEALAMLQSIVADYRDERGQHDDAVRVLRRLKNFLPDDLALFEQEADLLERCERTGEAGEVWRQISGLHRRNGEIEKTAACLARGAELAGDDAAAQIEVAEMFEQLEDIERATAFLMRAVDIHDRNDNLAEAAPALERVVQLNPGRTDFADALARFHERLGDEDEAIRRWLALGALYESNGEPDEAISVYMHLRELAPGDRESRRRLALMYESAGDRDATVREWRGLAGLCLEDERKDQAVESLEKVLEFEPRDEQALRQMADCRREMGDEDALFETLGRLEKVLYHAGRLDEAVAVLDELKTIKPDDPDLMNRWIGIMIKTGKHSQAAQMGFELIQLYFDLGQDAQALETMRRIAENEPRNVERRIALAQLVQAKGRPDAAQQEFFLAASSLIGEDEFEGCLEVCKAGVEAFADDVRLRELMGRALAQLGREDEAIDAQLQLAAILDERGEEEKAGRAYESILAERPDHRGALEAAVEWALRNNRTNAAVEHLMRLAEAWYVDGTLGRAVECFERIQQLDSTRLDLRARLAEMYLEAGDEDKAVETWFSTARDHAERSEHKQALELFERLGSMRPGRIDVLEALVGALEAAGRVEEHLRQVMNLAEAYIGSGRSEDARNLLRSQDRMHPSELEVWRRMAEICQGLDDADGVVEACKREYEIHRNARRLDQARECIQTALEMAPNDVDLHETLGDLCLSLSLRPEGIGHLRTAVAMLRSAGDNQRAGDLARRILKLDPANREIRHELATIHEALGEMDEALDIYARTAREYADAQENADALEILSHLLSLDPARAENRELYARLLQREERIDECVAEYLTLLGDLNEDADSRQSVKYCRNILAVSPDRFEAHEHLLGIYESTDKKHQAFKECLWLAEYHLAKNDNARAEQFAAKGMDLAPDDLDMRRLFVNLLVAQDRTAEAGEQLAELARKAEDRNDTRTTVWAMQKACEIDPENLEHRLGFADFLDRSGELARAREERIEIIKLMLAAGRMGEAREMADRLVESVIEDDSLRMHIAEIFDQAGLPEISAFHYYYLAKRAAASGDFQVARDRARRAIEYKPRHAGARETLIESLLQLGENADAFDQYNELFRLYMEADDIEAALKIVHAIIQLKPSDPEPRHKIIDLYARMGRADEMIEQQRKLAEIYVNMSDYDSAIQSLRNLISERPDDTQARMRYIDLYEQTADESELLDDYVALARIFVRKGSVVEATRIFEKVLKMHPDSPDMREEFVQFLFEQGQVSRALDENRVLLDQLETAGRPQDLSRALDRALNYAPDQLDLRERLAQVYVRTNKRGLALETFRSLARQYETEKREDKLIDALRQIIEIDELNVEYRQQLVTLLHGAGRNDEAVEQHLILARQYDERVLHDLAEREYRRVAEIDPERIEIWQTIVTTHLKIGTVEEITVDVTQLARLQMKAGRIKDAIRSFRQVLDVDPDNVDVLRNYIDAYSQIGLEQDLVDDYLHLADLYMARGEVGESLRIYNHLIEINPDDPLVKTRLDETQSLAKCMRKDGTLVSDVSVARKAATDAQSRAKQRKSASAPSNLEEQLESYLNILKLNPKNPNVLIQVAETYDGMGDYAKGDEHRARAAMACFATSELARGMELAEDYLDRNPNNAEVREAFNKARVQLDSMRALDRAIDAI